MDFFAAQDASRRATRLLILLFAGAVLAIIAVTNLLVMALVWSTNTLEAASGWSSRFFDWQVFLNVGIGVTTFIGLGSLTRLLSIRNGAAVAELLHGVRLADQEQDADRRKAMNVVEEMAIACGTPVPPVYLLPDDAINALAAGFTQSDAIIGLTRGAIVKLSREQLQGVVAHEFSHIINGDMALNMRLLVLVHGITLLGEMGTTLMRAGNGRRRSGQLFLLGLGLAIIGYVGTFFGTLIRAAVSRQREYLADASAVQFTRNPDGIAGALQRIRTDARGSRLATEDIAQFSHALFADGLEHRISRALATHPPLEERIRRLNPRLAADLQALGAASGSEGTAPAMPPDGGVPELAGLGELPAAKGVALLMARAGGAGTADTGARVRTGLDFARQAQAGMPEVLRQAAHDPWSARALVYALVLDPQPRVRGVQLDALRQSEEVPAVEHTLALYPQVRRLGPEYRLPLIELCLPALQELSKAQYLRFREQLRGLIGADGDLSLFEWSLQQIVIHNLDRAHLAPSAHPAQGRSRSLKASRAEVELLLSTVARAGATQAAGVQQAFAAGAGALPELQLRYRESAGAGLAQVDLATARLANLAPLKKPRLLKALAAAITADGTISTAEGELFRAVAALLDCPMPPLVIGSGPT